VGTQRQVGEYGEHPPVAGLVWIELGLLEDAPAGGDHVGSEGAELRVVDDQNRLGHALIHRRCRRHQRIRSPRRQPPASERYDRTMND
jgi:hypothetical protein